MSKIAKIVYERAILIIKIEISSVESWKTLLSRKYIEIIFSVGDKQDCYFQDFYKQIFNKSSILISKKVICWSVVPGKMINFDIFQPINKSVGE